MSDTGSSIVLGLVFIYLSLGGSWGKQTGIFCMYKCFNKRGPLLGIRGWQMLDIPSI